MPDWSDLGDDLVFVISSSDEGDLVSDVFHVVVGREDRTASREGGSDGR